MKWPVYLFAFYVLLLSGIPCSANDDCCNDEVVTTATNKTPAGNDHKTPRPCSPLFACNACHGVVVPNTIFDVLPQFSPALQLPFAYVEKSLPDFPATIWQPPQIA